MADFIDPRLAQRGARIVRAHPPAGRPYWRLVRAEWRNVDESAGKHHIFVNVIDANGRRVVGVPVRFGWPSGGDIKSTTEKPGEPYAVDFPMHNSGNPYFCEINSGVSDRIEGMGLGTIEQPHMAHHTSYQLVFQYTTMPVDDDGDPPVISPGPEPVEPPSNKELIRAIKRVTQMIRAGVAEIEDTLDELS